MTCPGTPNDAATWVRVGGAADMLRPALARARTTQAQADVDLAAAVSVADWATAGYRANGALATLIAYVETALDVLDRHLATIDHAPEAADSDDRADKVLFSSWLLTAPATHDCPDSWVEFDEDLEFASIDEAEDHGRWLDNEYGPSRVRWEIARADSAPASGVAA